jgi:hypothetical protein
VPACPARHDETVHGCPELNSDRLDAQDRAFSYGSRAAPAEYRDGWVTGRPTAAIVGGAPCFRVSTRVNTLMVWRELVLDSEGASHDYKSI